jgi:1-deoxy-D-xylulose-5-phosphate reductoisomerase
MMRTLTLLGATGSIGASTLDVVARHPDRFRVAALAANRDWEKLAALCRTHRPVYAAMQDAAAARSLAQALAADGLPTRVVDGPAGLAFVAALPEVDTVLAAIVGAAGLAPTLAAARAGKRILLANKEALVIGGELFMRAVQDGRAVLLPIDSEHNAIFQCLPADTVVGQAPRGIRRVLLTASGGPFRDYAGDLSAVTPDQACAHPNWVMGRKISVDSATLMNKGLELIEACALFGLPPEQVEILVHPQSIVHSMVEYLDGSVLAQLGSPDMRTPIAQALAWPQRIEAGVQSLDFVGLGGLDFRRPDFVRFPCLGLAIAAARAGGTVPAVLNAANEVAVQAFLDRRLNFLDIAAVIEAVMNTVDAGSATDLAAILGADRLARETAETEVTRRFGAARRSHA